MATRTQLPNMFYVEGVLLTLPIGADETIPQWLERIAFIFEYLRTSGTTPTAKIVADAKDASRLHLRRITHGAKWR